MIYHQRPEIKEKAEKARNTPEAKEKRRLYDKARRSDEAGRLKENKRIRDYKRSEKGRLKKSIKNQCPEFKKANNTRAKKARETNPIYRTACNYRCRLFEAFRTMGFKKTSKTQEMLGCSFPALKSHIESKFKKGMNWDNRALWHIDHIEPVASALSENHLTELFHFTNLRPLWKKENLSKGKKEITHQKELLIKYE